MVAAVQLERRVTGAGVFRIVIGKFSHRKEPCPVVLLEVDEGSELGLHCAVLSLCLAVGLRMEGGGESLLDAWEVAQRRPKL